MAAYPSSPAPGRKRRFSSQSKSEAKETLLQQRSLNKHHAQVLLVPPLLNVKEVTHVLIVSAWIILPCLCITGFTASLSLNRIKEVVNSEFQQCGELSCCCQGQLITNQDLSYFSIPLHSQNELCH